MGSRGITRPMAERKLRKAKKKLGAWVATVPWFLAGGTLALPRGPQREHCGSWDRFVR
jgi:hypothetical protein